MRTDDDDAGTHTETSALVDGVKTVAMVGHEGILLLEGFLI